MLSLRQNKDPSFPGHAPGKDTLRAANAATKVGVTGRKRVKRKRLPVVFPSFFVVPRQNKDSRRDGGHAPPQRHLERSAATTKEGFTGRKQPNEPREVRLLSSRRSPKEGANGGKREGERSERESVVPRQNKDSRRVGGHAPPQRHLERSAATTKVGANGGENARTSHAK